MLESKEKVLVQKVIVKKPKSETTKKKYSKGIKYLGGLLLTKMAIGGAALLPSNADTVNKLNVFPLFNGRRLSLF